MSELKITRETAAATDAVRCVHRTAFGQEAEAAIVDALRDAGALTISLVAQLDDQVVGHVALSPMQSPHPAAKLLGLGPIGVLPEHQRSGIGAALMRFAIDRARGEGFAGIVVLGHPEYYPKFGFVPASRFDIRCEYDVPDNVFMALELQPSGLTDSAGLVRYHAAFALATA